MFRVLVITLDDTRMSAMRDIWPNAEKFPGVRSPRQYHGCNLAHIAAAREGLKDASHVLVLEDDARPRVNAEAVYAACTRAAQETGWDVLSLCASADYKVASAPVIARPFCQGIYAFEASRQFVNADAVFWSRSALPLLDEFEALIQNEQIFLPIDIMIYNNKWNIDTEGSEPCLIQHLPLVDGKKYWPPDLTWNPPRTLIAWPPLTYQSTDYVSAHTGCKTPDYTQYNYTLDVRLRIDPIPPTLPTLNFVIGISKEVTTSACG